MWCIGLSICMGDGYRDTNTPSFVKIQKVTLQFLVDLIWNDPASPGQHKSLATLLQSLMNYASHTFEM